MSTERAMNGGYHGVPSAGLADEAAGSDAALSRFPCASSGFPTSLRSAAMRGLARSAAAPGAAGSMGAPLQRTASARAAEARAALAAPFPLIARARFRGFACSGTLMTLLSSL